MYIVLKYIFMFKQLVGKMTKRQHELKLNIGPVERVCAECYVIVLKGNTVIILYGNS